VQIPLALNNNAAGTSQELKFMAYARGLLTTTPPTTAGGFAPCTPSRELRPLHPFQQSRRQGRREKEHLLPLPQKPELRHAPRKG